MNNWEPTAEIDAAIRAWMAAQELPVTVTHYDFDREIYAWRHEQSGGSPTLRVSRAVLEDHSAEQLVRALDRLRVALMLRERRLLAPLVGQRDGAIAIVE